MRWEYQCRHCGCKGIDKMRDRETHREQMHFNSRCILEERQHLFSKIYILFQMHLLLPATYLSLCLHLCTCICSRLVLSCKHRHHHPQRTNTALGAVNCYWSSHIGKYWRRKNSVLHSITMIIIISRRANVEHWKTLDMLFLISHFYLFEWPSIPEDNTV